LCAENEAEEEFKVIVRDSRLEVKRGSDAVLSCSASGNVADVDRIEWQLEDGHIPPGIISSHLLLTFRCALSKYVIF